MTNLCLSVCLSVSSQTLIENHEFSNIWMKKKKEKEIWIIQICVKKKMMMMKKIWVQIWSLGEDFGQEMMRQWLGWAEKLLLLLLLLPLSCDLCFLWFSDKKIVFFFPFLPCFWSFVFCLFSPFSVGFFLWFSLSNYFIIIKVYATFFFPLLFFGFGNLVWNFILFLFWGENFDEIAIAKK